MVKKWGLPPQLHTVHEDEEERKVTWLELFYDLIYVATIIQLGNVLSDNVSPLGGLLFVLLFIPVWWSWTGMMFYFNRFVADDFWHRVLIFAQMIAITNMAISVTGAFGDTSRDFALAYFAVRVILVIFYIRAWRHVESARPLIRRYIVGFSAAASLWFISAFVPEPYRYGLWVLGLMLEFYVPTSAGSRRLHSLLPPDSPHMSERYGLFTIIVFGESFVKVVSGLAGEGITLASQVFGGLGFIIAFSLWWIYFDNIAGSAIRRAGAGPYIWIYTHLPLTIGITAIGVGIKKLALLHFGYGLPDAYRWLICAAVITCLVSIALLDLVTESKRPLTTRVRVFARLAAAVLVLFIGFFGGALSAVLTVSLIALVCTAQVVIDLLVEPEADVATSPAL
jgi:low temperature requirement protein LtrA